MLEVTALPQPSDVDTARVSQALSEALAGLLGEEPRGTWVVWRTLAPGAYAEHRDAPSLQPADTHPPLVRVMAAPGRPPLVVAAALRLVAETLVRELALAEGNALVRWDEAEPGRLYAGGRVVGA